MTSNYILGPADPVLRHSATEIALALKAAVLTKPRVIMQPALVLDSLGIQDILFHNVTKPSGVGIETIKELTSASDSFSAGKPVLSLATHKELKNGAEYFEAWSGVRGRLRKDPVYSSTLSRSIDPSKSPKEVLESTPRFQVGVDAIDNIFIKNHAVEKATFDFRKDFRLALEKSLQDYVESDGKPELKLLSCHLLNKIRETEEFSRSFIIRECKKFVKQDIYGAEFKDLTYRAFREGVVDQNWRFSHAEAIQGNSWEGFQEKPSVLKSVFPFWYHTVPFKLKMMELPYAGKYLSEVAVEDILKLRNDEGYLNQLKALRRALRNSKTGKLSKDYFEEFLDKLSEAFPSSKGRSPKQKLVRVAAIPAGIGWSADIGVRMLSTLLVNIDPNAILLGDLAWVGGSAASVAIIGISRKASEAPSLTREFKAFGMRLVKT